MRPALAVTLAAIEAGMAVLRARTPGTPPGDADDPHEANTWDLPDGNPIRRRIKQFARRQLRKILGTVPEIGAPLPPAFPPLADWTDPMASAMTPLISAYWDEAGKTTRARLGLDPDAWEVHDPRLHEKIRGAALAFCAETNATTDGDLAAALDRLRDELAAGLVDAGEAIPELTARVQAVFTRLSTWRAEMIARTEAARAVHAASLESARESGVVAGKKWLVSAGSCPKCQAIASEVNGERGIPLDQPFASGVGKDPAYANVPHPPLHPHCRCSLVFVLSPEYEGHLAEEGPEHPTFEEGPLGPEEKARVVAKMARAGPHDDLPRYRPSGATIVWPADRKARKARQDAVKEAARGIFGKRRTPKELASLIGAPDDARVSITGYPDSDRLFYRVDHPDLKDFHGWIERDGDRVIHEISHVIVVEEKRRQGLGTSIHGRMVEQGARLGVHGLKLDAARTEEEPVGYVFWPSRGYDGPLPGRIVGHKEFPAHLHGVRTLQDLLGSDEGRDFWQAHGETIPVAFDLAPGSPDRGRWIADFRAASHERTRSMALTREQRLALVPYPNELMATPEEIVDGLDRLVAYNRGLREERERREREAASKSPSPRRRGPRDPHA